MPGAPISRCMDLRIALLEDDSEQAEHTATLLRGVGHHVNVFSRGRPLLRQLNSETYDLLMLDWEVPMCRGMTCCSRFGNSRRCAFRCCSSPSATTKAMWWTR